MLCKTEININIECSKNNGFGNAWFFFRNYMGRKKSTFPIEQLQGLDCLFYTYLIYTVKNILLYYSHYKL